MADGAQQQSRRFSAFISYSRHDRAFARRLHRDLEGYRLPRRLVDKAGGGRNRLKPLFRDLEELTAAADLSDAIREGLADADFLIVVCSPAAAASVWVGREIEFFRTLHGDKHILAALIEGTSATAFPPALRAGGTEPLAADFRPEGGGRRLAMLKLIGALTDVWLDELIHRDAQRQVRRVVAVSASAVAATITVAALGGLTLTARADAERRRSETTGLVDYMLTDLRKAMQRTGRLDQLAALNDGAMQYYRHQDLKRLSEAQLRQRAKLLQAMGEDDEKRGKLEAARESFEDAHRTTAALLAAKPNDPDRIFAHAQSEYWVGFINWRNGDGEAARRGFEAYAQLAEKLVATDRSNPAWRKEVAYAETNLGLLAMRHDGDFASAERHFRAALRVMDDLSARQPTDVGLQTEIATILAWLADSQRLSGRYGTALDNRLAQRRILTALRAQDPQNAEVRADLLSNNLALARIDAERGNSTAALRRLDEGYAEAAALRVSDPENASYAKQARMFELFKVRTALNSKLARHELPALSQMLGTCSSPVEADKEIATLCIALRARIARLEGNDITALSTLASLPPRDKSALSQRWGLDLNHEIDLARMQK